MSRRNRKESPSSNTSFRDAERTSTSIGGFSNLICAESGRKFLIPHISELEMLQILKFQYCQAPYNMKACCMAVKSRRRWSVLRFTKLVIPHRYQELSRHPYSLKDKILYPDCLKNRRMQARCSYFSKSGAYPKRDVGTTQTSWMLRKVSNRHLACYATFVYRKSPKERIASYLL